MTSVKILYVDDEQSNRVVFEQSFCRTFDVVIAASGPDALELLKTIDVAVIVADQRMPKMSGNELLAIVKELHPDIIRVIITAHAELDPVLNAVNQGLVARYIIKPWEREELEAILRWGLEVYAIARQSSAVQLRLLETERLATLRSIGASIVHDLNQPVSHLLLDAQRLQTLAEFAPALERLVDRHDDELSQTEQTHLSELASELPTIADNLCDGIAVVTQLVKSTKRVTRRVIASSDDAVGPAAVIRFVLAACSALVTLSGGMLYYDGPKSLPRVALGHAELTQVLMNLITNAAHAIAGYEQIATPNIEVTACQRPGKVVFAVIDNGPGMSAEQLCNATKPFYTTRDGGTGLGLAQCRRLVEATGAKLEIFSTLGEGTTVRFALPQFE